MAGGGGRGTFTNTSPSELARLVRSAEDKTENADFQSELSSLFAQLLAGYNGRDEALVRNRLSEIKAALEDEISGTIDQLFGGSVAKHTYVDGLSDVDSLLLVNETGLEDHTPKEAIIKVADILSRSLSNTDSVTQGRMAVTVQYADGMQIQLLPALRTADKKLHVPSSRRDDWSHIEPESFTKALTARNAQCAGKLVPTIKLAKAINATLPEAQQLSGYHMESLGIAAFSGYEGPKTTAAMLPIFFDRAKDLVLTPMSDRTGQSVHVDAYLGDANSQERVTASHVLSRIAKRMRNATSGASIPQWQALLGLNE